MQVADVCANGVLQAAGWASRSCAGGNLSGGLSIRAQKVWSFFTTINCSNLSFEVHRFQIMKKGKYSMKKKG